MSGNDTDLKKAFEALRSYEAGRAPMFSKVTEPGDPRPTPRRRWLMWAGSVVAVAMVLAWWLRPPRPPLPSPEDDVLAFREPSRFLLESSMEIGRVVPSFVPEMPTYDLEPRGGRR